MIFEAGFFYGRMLLFVLGIKSFNRVKNMLLPGHGIVSDTKNLHANSAKWSLIVLKEAKFKLRPKQFLYA